MYDLMNKYKKPDSNAFWNGYRRSVHKGSTHRLRVAKEQYDNSNITVDSVIAYVNELLVDANMKEISNPYVYDVERIDYEEIKNIYGLESVKDIVWIKFAKDKNNKKYVGVIAASNDVNFEKVESKEYYDDGYYDLNGNWRWTHTTSGIIVDYLGLEWDKEFVLLFPLVNKGSYLTTEIECAIGNYLISKGINILDYYSHNY